jgi:4-amino-4-deoxy-L-arabinose transferase-like glycosyltransferase
VSGEAQKRTFLLRLVGSAGLFNIAVLVGLVVSVNLILRWRMEQFRGHGLMATYYDSTDFRGNVWRDGVEPFIDFSDEHHPHFKRPRFSATWTGTIVLPRTGRYVFATQSDDGSWLELDGRILVDNGGTHESRRVEAVHILSAGPHAIRVKYFQAGMGGNIQIYWTPAGRRGDLEYIPPTVLFPRPPAEVSPRRAPAIPPRDLPAAILLAVALLVACLLLARRPIGAGLRLLRDQRTARLDCVAFLLLVGGALALRLWDLSAAGQTWDEDVYWSAGRNYITSLLTGNLRASYFAWNVEHPALAKWIYGPATLVADDFGPARGVAAFIGALTCGFAFLAGRDLVGRRVGLVAGALCLVMPHVVAHGKIMGLEAPSGLLFTLGIWLFFRGMRAEPRALECARSGRDPQAGRPVEPAIETSPPPASLPARGAHRNSGYHLLAGLCAGLALATRLTNASLALAIVLLYLGVHWRQIRQERRFPVSLTIGLLPVVAALAFFAAWPYLWHNPLQHLGEMLIHWKPDQYQEYILGKLKDPSYWYFPLYFLVTLPAAALFGFLVGLARIFARRDLGHLTLLAWLLTPFIVIFSPMNRDGVRYLYPALIAGCLVIAAGVDWLAAGLTRLLRRPGAQQPLTAVLGAALGLYVLYQGLTVHPYYLDYYSELVGGPRVVAKRRWFEIAWWGEGLKEASRWVDRHAREKARVKVDANPRHVIELRPDLVWVEDDSADYIIYNQLFTGPVRAPRHRVAYVVRAAGAPLVWVYEREDL